MNIISNLVSKTKKSNLLHLCATLHIKSKGNALVQTVAAYTLYSKPLRQRWYNLKCWLSKSVSANRSDGEPEPE